MNWVGLVNQLRLETGESGASLIALTDAGLNDFERRMKSWINRAWVDIQAQRADWQFMRTGFSLEIGPDGLISIPSEGIDPVGIVPLPNAGFSAVGPLLNKQKIPVVIARYKLDSFRISTTGQGYADESLITFRDWDTFRNLYLLGQQRNNTARPIEFTVTPGYNGLMFGPVPDADYTVEGEFWFEPWEFQADSDVPSFSPQYHMLIVWRAMMFYAAYESAPEVETRAQKEWNRTLQQLIREQLRRPSYGPPLA